MNEPDDDGTFISSNKTNMSSSLLVSKVMDYLYKNREMSTFVTDWCRLRVIQIKKGSNNENNFDDTFLYQDFKRAFEMKLLDFIHKQGGNIDVFYTELKQASSDSDAGILAQVISAMTDYDTFIMVLRGCIEAESNS